MFLFIKTTDGCRLEFIFFNQQDWNKRFEGGFLSGGHDKILILLERALKEYRIDLKNIQGVVVLQGSASFTGIRLALTVANIIGFVFDLPVLVVKTFDQKFFNKTGKRLLKIKKFIPVKPFYNREPNITIKL